MAIPNTTPTPNELYNGEMNKMTDTELRVVLITTRATLGWEEDKETKMRKQEDWISHYQLIKKTGRSSRAISMAIDNCVKKGWIEIRDKNGNILDTKNKRIGNKMYFRLGRIFLDKIETPAESKEVEAINHQTPAESKIAKSKIEESKAYKRNTIQKKPITKDIAEASSASSLKKKKFDDTPMILQEFVESCKNSPQRHIQIVGGWAEAVEPNYTIKGQWDSFIRRNVRPAKNLIAFTDEQLQEAFDRLQKDIVKIDKNTGKKVGFITKFTLETLEKYL